MATDIDPERVNLTYQALVAQRNQFADENVNLKVDLVMKEQVIEALKKEILSLSTPAVIHVPEPLFDGERVKTREH